MNQHLISPPQGPESKDQALFVSTASNVPHAVALRSSPNLSSKMTNSPTTAPCPASIPHALPPQPAHDPYLAIRRQMTAGLDEEQINKIGGKLAWAIQGVLDAYPNVGTSGWWQHPGRHVEAVQRDRDAMKTPEFLTEVLYASLYLGARTIAFHIQPAPRQSAAQLARAATQTTGLLIRLGALMCAAHGMGINLEIAGADCNDALICDVQVNLGDAVRAYRKWRAAPSNRVGGVKEAA